MANREKSNGKSEAVCLLSGHPVALEGFERVLASLECSVQSVKLESQVPFDVAELKIPAVPIYVVDSMSSSRATEALVMAIREQIEQAKVLVLADSFDEATSFTLLRLGVKGMIRYAETDTQLPRAVRSISDGGYWVSRALLSRFVDLMLGEIRVPPELNPPAGLSPREREVLDALLKNLANKEIGDRLNISERTVKFHVSNLLQKFGVQRRADLILMCYQNRPPSED